MEEKKSVMVHPKAVPDPEVSEKAVRRRFIAAYKLRILKEAENCTEPGQLGALLRREGLYSSNLARWRRQVASGLVPRKRGPVVCKGDPHIRRIAELEKENERLKTKLKQAELIYGRADTIIQVRTEVLQAAYVRHPERFKGKVPKPAPVPDAVWINKPSLRSDEEIH